MSSRSCCQIAAKRSCQSLFSRSARPAVVSHISQQRCLSDIIDPPDFTPPIPLYVDRGRAESVEKKRARLLYQSRKRGMTENGLLLSTFAAKHLDQLNEEELTMYDLVINKPSNDWELYYWMIGNKPTPEEYDNSVMDMLKRHAKNTDRDVRLQQPNLPDLPHE